MAPWARLALVSCWILSLCSATLAGVHHVSRFQLISPWAAPGLPKRLHVVRMNDLALSAYDSNTRRLAPRSGYTPANQEFWSAGHAACMAWDSWVEPKYQALVQEVNTSSPQAAQPTVRVALVPGTQDWLCRLICHVTGFYPRNIEVIWERGGQVVHGEQLTSGILPNGDLTFQIQVSIELGQEGVGPAEHVCVVRHSSLGHDPLRVTWGAQKGPYRPAQTQPGTLDSAPATAKPAGNSLFTASSCPDATE
ncbi:uncharacterized protein [Lepidochelys kempii]|uniref:uncharacterized protein isoform X2 n=1 Tax=Lepidochelys kempii TaxID=8472 RepID=UPI003C6F7DC6